MLWCYFVVILQVLLMEKDINPSELDFLLRYPAIPGIVSPVDFLSNLGWGGIKVGVLTVTSRLKGCKFSNSLLETDSE